MSYHLLNPCNPRYKTGGRIECIFAGLERKEEEELKKWELPKEKYVEGGEHSRWSPPKLRDLKTSSGLPTCPSIHLLVSFS